VPGSGYPGAVLSRDVNDLLFRVLVSTIFLGLGMEHIFSDELIQFLMPHWVPFARLASIGVGVLLLIGGSSIALGFHLRAGAFLLIGFLTVVTASVHLPGVLHRPEGIPEHWAWVWDIMQRTNLVKNTCLIGVCIHLTRHRVGRYSLDARRGRLAGDSA